MKTKKAKCFKRPNLKIESKGNFSGTQIGQLLCKWENMAKIGAGGPERARHKQRSIIFSAFWKSGLSM